MWVPRRCYPKFHNGTRQLDGDCHKDNASFEFLCIVYSADCGKNA